MRKLQQRGDTIVEVMIAVVIAGAVLVGAYAASSRSSQSIRIAQERSEGTKYATAMVERLHADPALYSATAAPVFCGLNPSQAATPPTACPVEPSSGIAYRTFVARSGSNPATYTVTTQWDGLRGNLETVVYVYRTAK